MQYSMKFSIWNSNSVIKTPLLLVLLQTNKQGKLIGMDFRCLLASKMLVGFVRKFTQTRNPLSLEPYDTLCSIRSLSATIAMNSLFVGFDLLMFTV